MSVIKIENLWKEYRLGVIGHGTLTHDLQSWWARVLGKEDPNAKIAPMFAGQEKHIEGDHFWALRDINLEVKQGEILGIIGKNGAGKSTLLKILSRVTAPTRGCVKIKGRIASLLEVGTGFHPELTGLENIFMNGVILGMSKNEIRKKLDEIIVFSGVEQYIGTPVKRYSSGMRVRLAFAVAAHLDPEILVVDEVLAVGDAEFHKKCLGKMGEVAGSGRTILFVSHNMSAVQNLCTRSICLKNGSIQNDGDTADIIHEYLRIMEKNIPNAFDLNNPERKANGPILFTGGQLLDDQGMQTKKFIAGQSLTFELKYKNPSSLHVFDLIGYVYNDTGTRVFRIDPDFSAMQIIAKKSGVLHCLISRLPLPRGQYRFAVVLRVDGVSSDVIPNAFLFEVVTSMFHSNSNDYDSKYGTILVDQVWTHVQIEETERILL